MESGCSRVVSIRSQVCSFFSNASEHVGKQDCGGSGCRALAGSGGIAGGSTRSGGKGGSLLAQLASSSVSAASIVLLSAALVLTLGMIMPLGLAALIVGVGLGLIAAIVLYRGIRQLQQLTVKENNYVATRSPEIPQRAKGP